MTRPAHRLRRLGLAVVVGAGLAAATTAQPTLDDRLDRLTDGLGLEAGQQAALTSIASQYADAGRADLWTAAAEVYDVLTPQQHAQLPQAAEARHQARGGQRGDRAGRDGMQGRRGRGAQSRRAATGADRGQDRPQLTDDQRRAVRDVLEDARDRREALVGQLRDGRVTDDAFADQMESLRSSSRARLAEVLPADALARMDERREQREAVRQAREAALDLTAEQKGRLQTLRLDRVRSRPDALDVRGLDEEGRLDRRALHRAQRERHEQARPERRAARQAASDVLTDRQRDVAALHRVLARAPDRARRDRRPRGR